MQPKNLEHLHLLSQWLKHEVESEEIYTTEQTPLPKCYSRRHLFKSKPYSPSTLEFEQDFNREKWTTESKTTPTKCGFAQLSRNFEQLKNHAFLDSGTKTRYTTKCTRILHPSESDAFF